MSKSWYWILLALVLLALCAWLWTQWSDCKTELDDCKTELDRVVDPPPGPIIDIDPKADFAAGVSAFSIEGSTPTCISVTTDTINSVAVGPIDMFETLTGTPLSTVTLDRFEADFEFAGTTKTLVIEQSSSGFNWELDGTMLTGEDRGTIYELREDLCAASIVGTPQITWTAGGTTRTAISDETVELRTDE